MSIEGEFNRQQYEKFFQTYLDSNKDGTVGGRTPMGRVEILRSYLPTGRKVLEIGSGIGGDTEALHLAGYQVNPSDFIEGFLGVLRDRGFSPLKLDAKKDTLPQEIDALYANAVFVHFSPDELTNLLQKASTVLKNEKIVFFSVIKGEGSERSTRARGFERDFHYYTLDTLANPLNKTGFTILASDEVVSPSGTTWIQVVAKFTE